MSYVKTWYTMEEATEKFGLKRELIGKWIEEGTVRTESSGKEIIRINGDDVDLKVQELTGI